MGFFEAVILAMAIFWGLNELGREIRKGLVEAAKIAKQSESSNVESAENSKAATQ
jgi:hypothetical protein